MSGTEIALAEGMPPQDPEMKALSDLVDKFAQEMKRKLHQKYLQGYSGWDDPFNRRTIGTMLVKHVDEFNGQFVDIANLAAMLWNFEQKEAGK